MDGEGVFVVDGLGSGCFVDLGVTVVDGEE